MALQRLGCKSDLNPHKMSATVGHVSNLGAGEMVESDRALGLCITYFYCWGKYHSPYRKRVYLELWFLRVRVIGSAWHCDNG